MALPYLAWLLLTAAARPYSGAESFEDPAPYTEVLAVHEPPDGLEAMAWTHDSRALWVGGFGGPLYLLDATTAAISRRVPLRDENDLDALVLAPNGTLMAALTDVPDILLIDLTTGRARRAARLGDLDILDGPIAFSSNGARIFGLHFDGDDDIAILEAWDVASGRSVGRRRLREPNADPDDFEGYTPTRVAGSHVFTDEELLLVRPHPLRMCDGRGPHAAAGAVGWYGDGDGALRRLADCTVVRASSRVLTAAAPPFIQLAAEGTRAAFLIPGNDTITLGLVDLTADADLGRLALEPALAPTFAVAPDGSQIAVHYKQQDHTGVAHHVLTLWRPVAAPGAPVRRLDVHMSSP
jgi:hypothetical protein